MSEPTPSSGSTDEQAALDRSLSPSRTVERLEHYLWLYHEQTRLVVAEFGPTANRNLRYGPDERHLIDHFPASGEPGTRPLLVFLHGGFWQALSKDAAGYPALACRSVGVDFAAINYRLGQTTRLTGIVDDVRAALEFLGEHADELGFDRRRVVLAGHSAGAHLAAMIVARGGVGSLDVVGASLIGGVFDLEPVRRSYVNDVMRMTSDEAEALGPAALVPELRCPVLVTYAELDTPEFARQSRLLADRWSVHLPVNLAPPQLGLNHFNSPMELADPASSLFLATVAMAAGDVAD